MGLFDLFKKDNSPSPEKLIKAAKKGNLESVNAQLEMGTDVNCRDGKGRTPLIWASCGFWQSFVSSELEEYAKIIKILLEKGADINARDKEGLNALLFVTAFEWIEAAKMLIEAGADLNTKDSNGNTALIYVSEKGTVETVKMLIEAGADLNSRNNEGDTALIFALYNGWVEIAKMFMEAGAQIDDKDEVLTLFNEPALPMPEASPPFPEFAKRYDISLVVEAEKGLMELQISAQRCTVNWGDDSGANEYNNIKEKNISHRYPKAGNYTITINAEGLSRFQCCNINSKATAIYLNNCPQLVELICYHNKLASLDISRCTALETLFCSGNKLTYLNLSNNSALDYLSCGNNLLTCLDISNNTQLSNVDCSYNQLSILNVNRNSAIARIQCNNNQLSKHELNRIFNQLPNYNSSYGTVNTWYAGATSIPTVFFACADNPGFYSCYKKIAQNKKWLVWKKAMYMAATTAGTPGHWQEDIFH